MQKYIFYIFLFVTQVCASSNDDNLYAVHIGRTYASAAQWSEASEDAISTVKSMITAGGSVQDILTMLSDKRAKLPNKLPGFGALRKMHLLTPGHNYFVMRACVATLLQTMFGDFGSNTDLHPLQPSSPEGYTSRIMSPVELCQRHVKKMTSLKMPTDPDPLEEIRKQQEPFDVEELAAGMFDRKLGLWTKQEFQDGGMQGTREQIQSRVREAHKAQNYYGYTKFKVLEKLGEASKLGGASRVQLHPELQEYFQRLDELEKTNPGRVIVLERKFLGVDAQKILVLIHSEAKSWEECRFVLVHCHHQHIPFFDRHLAENFDAIKNEKDPQKLQELFYQFEYILSAQTPCWRGASAIKSWFTSGLYGYKGFVEPKRGFCETDQYAQILPWPEFLTKMSAKDGPLKPL